MSRRRMKDRGRQFMVELTEKGAHNTAGFDRDPSVVALRGFLERAAATPLGELTPTDALAIGEAEEQLRRIRDTFFVTE